MCVCVCVQKTETLSLKMGHTENTNFNFEDGTHRKGQTQLHTYLDVISRGENTLLWDNERLLTFLRLQNDVFVYDFF